MEHLYRTAINLVQHHQQERRHQQPMTDAKRPNHARSGALADRMVTDQQTYDSISLNRIQGDKATTVTHVPRAVFGIPLEESLDVAQIANLPAIVFRCIQYLEAKKADQEEGIYRLSGSSAVIKSLKDRFNMGTCSGNRVVILISAHH
jgi:hypothetical protein